MSLHKEFYSFRTKVWDEFEKLVRTGCDYIGEFPVVNGEILRRTKTIADTDEIIIRGIVADSEYSLHKGTDLIVGTTKIKVMVHSVFSDEIRIEEVEPDILNLQCLSTYLSGGFSVYKK